MSEHPVKRRKKLIEVAIPLEAINAASAREKSIRHGHPSTLHLWWSRKPMAAARAVIFCQMVDDPSEIPEEFPTSIDQENERLRLFALISELATWESTNNHGVLERAREELARSWRRCCFDNQNHPKAGELFNPDIPPAFHDPFAGGGTLPLEAQRLGMQTNASDLNPVAVLINKAVIEIPPKFKNMPPINPEARSGKRYLLGDWKGAQGLAEDVRYYGSWIRDEAEKQLAEYYPKVEINNYHSAAQPHLKAYEGESLQIIAWIWARTVKSPNPSFSGIDVPLASTFLLSTKPGKETYIHPVITSQGYTLEIRQGKGSEFDAAKTGTSAGKRAAFKCIMSGDPISYEYIRGQGQAGKIGARLMAIVAEGKRERVYIKPCIDHEDLRDLALSHSQWKPEIRLEGKCRVNVSNYGLDIYGDLFTTRQLLLLNKIADLSAECRERIANDLLELKLDKSNHGSVAEVDPKEYADAIGVYQAFLLGKLAESHTTICTWSSAPKNELVVSTFRRQAIPMSWEFAEANPFANSSGSISKTNEAIAKVLDNAIPATVSGHALQLDATRQTLSKNKIISTDPPYYDNISYADLSDFFYAWMRRLLKHAFPDVLATMAAPRDSELVATPYRHKNQEEADQFFLKGMSNAMRQIAEESHPAFPKTIYYAFKQAESKSNEGFASTGWETFLSALIDSGFTITGTWPIRTEREGRTNGVGANTLSSSILLSCQSRIQKSRATTRSEFRRALRMAIPTITTKLERSNVAPVDIAQAAIGPGMEIYSSFEAVLNSDDSRVSVRDALTEINSALDEHLSSNEGDLDSDSRFALTFFESYGFTEREFGDAENLAIARNVSVAGVAQAGILRSVAGKVKLLLRTELEDNWDPTSDKRLCIWEATQQLIRRLEAEGETAAATLLTQLKQISGHGDLAASCKDLAYRLYNHCEKTKQAEEARAYNGLVIAWPELERLASNQPTETAVQASLI